ncbi:Fe-S cluster assembly transcriptional regulator IscR [Aliikangiella marina]|uniref:Fe-S cluster assembly transcriptional regulator IscR n=1 Tax=Aliikangiella marina TaxID=1712262 RepID=A0A545T363_9GAMM|nr:Fe-S cluster assembly transcriptional regulator IscR [Aliikangiella marina]TQV71657.1 Fe-S cluster assembly transcriptional regulator IscR [Aliikangiella marina]
MRLTTKGRYAVTAMLDLAINSVDRPVNLNDISERQAISLSYLEQLFSKLRRENLVRSIRGPGGGYQLNAPQDEISVADIINAVNESMDVSRCEGRANCHDGQQCLTHNLWIDLSARINSFLDNISIGELIRQNEEQAKHRSHLEESQKIELTTLN